MGRFGPPKGLGMVIWAVSGLQGADSARWPPTLVRGRLTAPGPLPDTVSGALRRDPNHI